MHDLLLIVCDADDEELWLLCCIVERRIQIELLRPIN